MAFRKNVHDITSVFWFSLWLSSNTFLVSSWLNLEK